MKFNIGIPSMCILHFDDVEAENKESAIEKCTAVIEQMLERNEDPFVDLCTSFTINPRLAVFLAEPSYKQ